MVFSSCACTLLWAAGLPSIDQATFVPADHPSLIGNLPGICRLVSPDLLRRPTPLKDANSV
jgi:hypothetical protein